MSSREEQIDWLENKKSDNVKHYDFSNFKNIRPIGQGAFGSVSCGYLDNMAYALKSFNNDDEQTLKNIVREVKSYNSVHHENILQFYGITIEIGQQGKKYSLVLEYADSGTLKNYLKDNEFGWVYKVELALQLANAISSLHENNIIHRDLHADNVLIHKGKIKLADFGLSKKITESTSITTEMLGVVPYIDPESFNNKRNVFLNQDKHYKLNEKSDIYSIGVIMWQISSGRRPFYRHYPEGVKYDISLILSIRDGDREKIVDGTPTDYSNLYTRCWKGNPNERPDIKEVVTQLQTIASKRDLLINTRTQVNIVESINEENVLTDNSNQNSYDINRSLLIDNIPHDIIQSKSTTSRETTRSGLSRISNQESTDLLNHSTVNKLIKDITEKLSFAFDIFDQIQQIINEEILRLGQTVENFIVWLTNNQEASSYKWLFGLFYYYNIIDIVTEEDKNKAFQLFLKAAEDNFPLAQICLAKCYCEGYGTKKDKCLAFEWYKKSVENKSIIGQFYLGYCYENGIGIEKDEKEAVCWYEKANNNHILAAKFYLANCYRTGKGVKKNETKAFEYYKKLAKHHEVTDAQYHLGNCYNDGIGTKIDKELANCWYKKAANSGSIIAKDILKENEINPHKILINKRLSQFRLYCFGQFLIRIRFVKAFDYFKRVAEIGNEVALHYLGCCYRDGIGVEKNKRIAFELFNKSAEQGYIDGIFRLGYCYDKGIGTIIDKAKAFKLYEIAAKKGNLGAQNNLGRLYEKGEGTEKNLKEAIRWYKKAADNGNRLSQYNLGICYENGIGVEKSDDKAFEYYKKSAKYRHPFPLNMFHGNEINVEKDVIKAFESYKQKYIDAQYKVAYFYDKGIGTKTNKKGAIKLYKKAAKRGNKFAQIRLGILYEKEKKFNKAIYWYNEAAENEIALYNLGRCYEYGMGVDKNDKLAFKYYQKSAEQGHIDGKFRLGNCFDKGIGTDINKKRAFELYKEVAGEGNNFAQNILGYFYEKGEGTKKDVKEAIFWYRKAADNGNEISLYNLGICYEDGIGVKKDEVEAFKFFKKSQERGYQNAQHKVAHYLNKGIELYENDKDYELIN
ncbi:hypothetical protein RclHR1_07700002 [Rhizophagus clarus]|uniref:Kinase-like domain-containing protein n=1 Tax=Rhizophagus clarus TaxID=94130 RepID=A0A2Z6SLY0_9GLOM|nr:hypothetical protein RclHR1_07700002 [Rhizophagus clarus]GES72660.1 kinase-like domain-containing protein [Rhizophagus clarus]